MIKMLNEIFQQPDVIEKIIKYETENIKNIADIIRNKNINLIFIAARGTSDNAAVLGKYLFEYFTGIPVSLSSPSLFTLYNKEINFKNSVVIGISQSGEAVDVIEVLKRARQKDAITIGITNTKNSKLSKICEYVIYTHGGKERSLAATKTYIGQLAILYLLCGFIKQDRVFINNFLQIPDIVRGTLKIEKEIKDKVERYRFVERCIVIGRGFNFATALETALKLKETSYILAEPFSAADFLHGPIAVVEGGFPVIVYAPSGKSYKMVADVVERLKKTCCELIIISDKDKILKHSQFPVKIKYSLSEILTPIVYILFGQIFACYLAQAKGLSPDLPRYLKKITKTK